MYGCPVWYAKQITPSAEFTYWKARQNMRWKENTPASYEGGLTRMMIAQSMGGVKNAKLEDYMLSTAFKDPKKELHEMDEEERQEEIEKSMAAWGGWFSS